MNDPFARPEAAFDALLRRLVERHGFQRLDAAAAEGFAPPAGPALLLLTDEPARCPEAWDAAVVLPEVLAALGHPAAALVADPAASAVLARRWAVERRPALVALRDGEWLGSLEGMLDWDAFAPAVARLLAQAPRRAPGIGIPLRVAQAAGACHP